MLKMTERKDIISVYDETHSVRATAKRLHINRKTVQRYVDEYIKATADGDESLAAFLKSEPTSKGKGCARRKKALTEEVCLYIKGCLDDNRAKKARGDRKLCMKATDIHESLLKLGYQISYPTVCNYIHKYRTADAGLAECYIRQVYEPGYDCEFDWGEFHLTIDGRRKKVYIAVFTLAYSNYRMAFLFFHQDTQAFIESHRLCFNNFNGVPRRMVYDNMRVAVKSFVGGKLPTDELIRMENAWGFCHRFCNIRSGNEKGHVERSVEFVRRKAFCDMDTFDSLEQANKHLYDVCMDMNMSPSSPATADIISRSAEDLDALLKLKEGPGSYEHGFYQVDKYATVSVRGVRYSVPETLVGRKVSVFIYPNYVVARDSGKVIARHERLHDCGWQLDIMHYLATFRAKPGSVAGSAALSCAAPEIRSVFRNHFEDRPADFIDILRMVRDNGLSLEDFIIAYDMMLVANINPSTPGVFEQMLLPGREAPKPAVQQVLPSSEIEARSAQGLQKLMEIMNKSNI